MVWGLDWVTGPAKPEVKPVREKSRDGGYVAPDRSTRDLCYESRDLFYACLDKHNILDANKDDELARQKCPRENAEFERDCAKSWIKYFKDKRVMEYKRDQTYAQINKEDAEMAARSKAQKKEKGGIGSWFFVMKRCYIYDKLESRCTNEKSMKRRYWTQREGV